MRLSPYTTKPARMGDNEIDLTTLVENGEKEQVRNRVRGIAGKEDIDTPRDGDGRTPLGIAVENGDKDMVEVLVNAGADINKPCPATPLMQAVVLTNFDSGLVVTRLLVPTKWLDGHGTSIGQNPFTETIYFR